MGSWPGISSRVGVWETNKCKSRTKAREGGKGTRYARRFLGHERERSALRSHKNTLLQAKKATVGGTQLSVRGGVHREGSMQRAVERFAILVEPLIH